MPFALYCRPPGSSVYRIYITFNLNKTRQLPKQKLEEPRIKRSVYEEGFVSMNLQSGAATTEANLILVHTPGPKVTTGSYVSILGARL